ncbi:RET [Mytilus edulis]|uniref:receptor protein-tyrosine kinase n=1 Tax=Mytilus edulis TaxID=6550 RepID=A0A8S3STX7_MYTED|nr:RET [Mytilus edulis]
MRYYILCLLVLFQGAQCLYFKQYRYKFCNSVSNQVLVDSSLCVPGSLKYTVSRNAFTINSNGLVTTFNAKQGINDLIVKATCTEDGLKKETTALADVITNCDPSSVSTDQKNLLCFDGTLMNFTITENVLKSVLGKLSVYSGINNGFTREYILVNKDQQILKFFGINSTTSEFSVLSPLDFELKTTWNLKVICQLTQGKTSRNYTANLNVIVQDQNDSPPLFQDGSNQIKSVLVTNDKKRIEVIVTDKDDFDCSKFSVQVFGDSLGICHAISPLGFRVPNVTICRLIVNINNTRPKVPLPEDYTCNVAFIDEGYMLSSNETRSDRVILAGLPWQKGSQRQSTFIIAKMIQFVYRINRSAVLFSEFTPLVYKFPEHINKTVYVMNPPKHAFDITSGIVYVSNADTLRQSDIGVKVTVISHPDNFQTDLFISVIGQYHVLKTDKPCNESCSRFMYKQYCETGCGLGAPNGKCVWRQGNDGGGLESKYSTCTPDLHTCPDQVCDPLERAFHLLCPQDCTTEAVGIVKQDPLTGRGILQATGPCWCDYNGKCSCFEPPPFKSTTPLSVIYKPGGHNSSTKDRNQTIENVRVDPVLDDKLNNSDHTICDIDCKITIATICGCISALACLFVLVWKTRRFKCQRNKTLKHVGSVASMSVIPSDYFDDRDYRTQHSSPQYGPYYKESYNSSVSPEDAKWEFEREHLQLDTTLGEGEFGKVVKAKAYNLDGKQNYTEVAVKMLKNCASGVEQQALWSEFNLLKDVQHPNVIRLLGACTQNGPTYLIVEYCEHGSLLSYLRNSRLEENGYVNQRYKPSKHISNPKEPPELLTIRDLLSFGWQIAKGMKYLSEIKLVHRDLAARNVLVGSGKVLKISDFGLTRDVYEADTYLKQSKGRIPVKWLAPESLYAQIYTTQSDVWSFGIVLWEVVTLGAPPYPGVPPERLYNLLLAGYRMDRPENCSDELYAVMQKCWKTDPQDRPTFSKLADIFDRMLQHHAEYLELTGGFEDDTSDLFGSRYAPSVSGISILGSRPLPVHSEPTPMDNRNSGSSYLTPALTNPIDTNTRFSDSTLSKREQSETSEMASLLIDNRSKNPFINEGLVSPKAEQTVV